MTDTEAESKQTSEAKTETRDKDLGLTGRDEMNLAEFPFASLSSREKRKSIEVETWVTDREGNREKQRWVVSGASTAGLPTEVDERVYVALMAITKQQGFAARKVPFSIYQVLEIMGLSDAKSEYQVVERSLKRLVGATIYAEGAFWDNEKKLLRKKVRGFHLIDKYWLAYKERDREVIEEEGIPAYVVWGEDIWQSMQKGYIKSLDIGLFFSLQSAVSRRLYRLLDKMFYRRDRWEIDIFTLAQKLGMVRYRYPSKVWEKLRPGVQELREREFLEEGSLRKVKANGKTYTRVAFVKAEPQLSEPQPEESRGQAGRDKEPPDELGQLWEKVLDQLKLRMTKATFATWLQDSRLLSIDDHKAVVGAPNEYAKDWIENRLRKVVEGVLTNLGHEVELEARVTRGSEGAAQQEEKQ